MPNHAQTDFDGLGFIKQGFVKQSYVKNSYVKNSFERLGSVKMVVDRLDSLRSRKARLPGQINVLWILFPLLLLLICWILIHKPQLSALKHLSSEKIIIAAFDSLPSAPFKETLSDLPLQAQGDSDFRDIYWLESFTTVDVSVLQLSHSTVFPLTPYHYHRTGLVFN